MPWVDGVYVKPEKSPDMPAATRPQPLVCTRCATLGEPMMTLRGSGAVELALWLLILVPGIIYSVWRRSSPPVQQCPACGSEELVPPDSPTGQRLIQEKASGS